MRKKNVYNLVAHRLGLKEIKTLKNLDFKKIEEKYYEDKKSQYWDDEETWSPSTPLIFDQEKNELVYTSCTGQTKFIFSKDEKGKLKIKFDRNTYDSVFMWFYLAFLLKRFDFPDDLISVELYLYSRSNHNRPEKEYKEKALDFFALLEAERGDKDDILAFLANHKEKWISSVFRQIQKLEK